MMMNERAVFSNLVGYRNDLLICLAAGIMSLVWFEVLKIFRKGKRALS
jgi:hypothetical protein